MADSTCNYRFGGPAMKPHRDRLKWNFTNILNIKEANPHNKEADKPAYIDLFPSLLNIPIGYAKLCPTKAGTLHSVHITGLVVSVITNIVLITMLII